MSETLTGEVSPADVELLRCFFDELFYMQANPGLSFAEEEPLMHFIRIGSEEGRDPAPWFSLQDYSAAVGPIDIDPFLHFLRHGRKEGLKSVNSRKLLASDAEDLILSPELKLMQGEFDDVFYMQQNADIELDGMTPLQHFAEIGWRQGLDPTPWFSITAYASLNPDVRGADCNPFWHYLRFGRREGRNIIDRSALASSSEPLSPNVDAEELALVAAAMDNEYYKAACPHVDFSKLSPAEHYCAVGWRAGLDPSENFSTLGYLQANEDVRSVGLNPLLHYLVQGRRENRSWSAALPFMPSDGADGVSEWKGYDEVWSRASPFPDGTEPQMAALDFTVSLLGADLAAFVKGLSFAPPRADQDVTVSVIIPCLNEELVTAECLASLAKALPATFNIEVLVADNGSSDPLFTALASHSQIRCIRFSSNIGFGPACNAAAEEAKGRFLFFLNNDAQVAPDCLELLVKQVQGDGVGIVGPKILGFDGRLQEAGCLLKMDGTGHLIGFSCNPRTPRFNYVRNVEHVSGAAIMLERILFQEMGGFDPIYAPAYCEDADLSLKVRASGRTVVYVPDAVVAHHLSRTSDSIADRSAGLNKRQRLARNRQALRSRWSERLATTDLRTIAFYLPQYHPVAQNDLWWGKGFTDWSNLAKARPNFTGHHQPRYPADLGYYDLRVPEVMEQQAALARRYGVSGFCYYYYMFNGERLLNEPLEQMLASGRPDFPFCLCWANENWTRRWDGRENEILVGQSYTDQYSLTIAEDIARYFKSERYIKIGGRPLMLVYRAKEIPFPKRFLDVWRNYCRNAGIGEICIALVESFELSAKPEDPTLYGCDISVEFPAHGMVHDAPLNVNKLNPKWTGSVHDYRELALAFMQRSEAGFRRLRSVLVSWDSTPRHPNRSLVLENSTPGAFQAWLEWTYQRTLEQNLGDERLVFINAWNEWCEGSYLEPDLRYGHAYLQAVQNALENVRTGSTYAV